jgi:hypothetical protein
MKNLFLKLLLGVLVVNISSCQKDDVDKVVFDVTVDKNEISAGDSVQFSFNGNADIVSFFSGEKGHEYKYRNRTYEEGSGLELTISSRVLNGSQEQNLRLLYSTTFSGIYDKESIKDEEWIDITDKFTWSTAPGNNQVAPGYTVSGPIDLTDLIVKDKPIYFALKYESQTAASNALGGKTYRLPVFDLVSVTSDGTRSNLANYQNIVYSSIPIINTIDDVTNKFKIAQNSATDRFLQYVPNVRADAHLHWGVSLPFTPGSLNPDKPVPIKAFLDRGLTSYTYKFNQPGTYVVTFVAKNITSEGSKEAVKQVEIKVN